MLDRGADPFWQFSRNPCVKQRSTARDRCHSIYACLPKAA
jgi:hypothetical protein